MLTRRTTGVPFARLRDEMDRLFEPAAKAKKIDVKTSQRKLAEAKT